MLGFVAAAFVSLAPVPNSSHRPMRDHQRCAYWYRQRCIAAPNNQVVAVFAPQPIGAHPLARNDATASMDHWVTAFLDQRLRPERYAQ